MYLELKKRKSFVLKMFSRKKKKKYLWSNVKDVDTHGINLKSTEEIELLNIFLMIKECFQKN